MDGFLRRRAMTSSSPSEYQLCEYIDGMGQPYIDTGLYPQDYDTVVLDMEILQKGGWDSFFGTQAIYSSFNNTKRFGFSNDVNRLVFCCGTNQHNIYHVLATGTRYTVECLISDTARKLTINNQVLFSDSIAYTFNSSTPTYLFCGNYANQVKTGEIAYMRLYEAVFSKEGTEVLHLLPCYEKHTEEVGMLDSLSGDFYQNAGSGAFTKGADV